MRSRFHHNVVKYSTLLINGDEFLVSFSCLFFSLLLCGAWFVFPDSLRFLSYCVMVPTHTVHIKRTRNNLAVVSCFANSNFLPMTVFQVLVPDACFQKAKCFCPDFMCLFKVTILMKNQNCHPVKTTNYANNQNMSQYYFSKLD